MRVEDAANTVRKRLPDRAERVLDELLAGGERGVTFDVLREVVRRPSDPPEVDHDALVQTAFKTIRILLRPFGYTIPDSANPGIRLYRIVPGKLTKRKGVLAVPGRTLGVRLPSDLIQELDDIARARNCPRTGVIRRALRVGLDNYPSETEKNDV